ncbi:hypothetical protein FA15DRAFT_753515 [Coprinopsis marcescibilis]|uniref:Uncharacterized protein n=1 Tax=Coprinopsis marcescibilis TaxID=230819 RepID=A0A5C3L6M3_COPMA|nr:hypothetical protein FA15DRAFT_753515 [Coprinopsis marcescibilis]
MMPLKSKPLFQKIDLKPEDFTSDDKVVWLMYFTEWSIAATGLKDIIGQQGLRSLYADQAFYAGDMPDRDPGSKERLVLAIYFCPYYPTNHENWIKHTMSAHAKSFPDNHRAALIFANNMWKILDDTLFLHNCCKIALNVAGHFTSVLVRVRFGDWQVDGRTRFNEILGDLIRAGTDCIDVDELRGLEIIKYVLNHDRFRLEEEMIGWNPVVSTNAGKIYKEDLATLAPGPLEKWRN